MPRTINPRGAGAPWRVPAVAAFLLAVALIPASPASAAGPTGSASIVGGKTTTVERWPWQVALATAPTGRPGETPQNRMFCGGTLIAPTIVVTAAHCAYQVALSSPGRFTAILGRTRLNQTATGEEIWLADSWFPTNGVGIPKFQPFDGNVAWDVGLVELTRPSAQRTIAIAGPGEGSLAKPGREVFETGYGLTGPNARQTSNVLKMSRSALQEDALCKQTYLWNYQPKTKTMVCLGSPDSSGSTCNGDSGGPLVAPLQGGGYRLLGATSYGESNCGKATPSVDTRLFGNGIRSWIESIVVAEAGISPLGTGGRPQPMPGWCRVSDLGGRTAEEAKRDLTKRGCRLGRVKRQSNGSVRPGRVFKQSTAANWIKEKGWKVDVTVAR